MSPTNPSIVSCSTQFQSIMTLSMDKILRAFPDVPWAFVYREPVQVMQSHFKKPTGLRGESEQGVKAEELARSKATS